MLYRKTIIEEYTYESDAERKTHVATKVLEGYTDSGQIKERIRPAVLLSGGSYPVWDSNPDDFTWYSKLTKVEEPGVNSISQPSKAEHTNLFTSGAPAQTEMSVEEHKLRRLHEFALVGVGDSKEVRALVNDCYLTLLALVSEGKISE